MRDSRGRRGGGRAFFQSIVRGDVPPKQTPAARTKAFRFVAPFVRYRRDAPSIDRKPVTEAAHSEATFGNRPARAPALSAARRRITKTTHRYALSHADIARTDGFCFCYLRMMKLEFLSECQSETAIHDAASRSKPANACPDTTNSGQCVACKCLLTAVIEADRSKLALNGNICMTFA